MNATNKITLGKFEVGQTVKPSNVNSYASERRGKVVEVTETRIRVLWEKQANGVMGKRTWMKPASLIQCVGTAPRVGTAPQEAVGPGGWLLDTAE